VWMKLDRTAKPGLKGRSLPNDGRSSVSPAEPHRPVNTVRPRPWNNHLDEDYVGYNDGSSADDSSNRVAATRATIYIGIVSFSAVIVVLCLIASSLAFGPKCCPRLALFCGCDEAAVTTSTAEDTGNDNTPLPSSIVIDTLPSYDEVIGRRENRISAMTTTVAIDDLNDATGDDVPLASVSRGISVAGYRNTTTVASRALRESRTSNVSPVSPPTYLQVIREWAATGIVINKTLIPTPPPSYSSLASKKNATGKRGDVGVSRIAYGDGSLSRVTVSVGLSLSSPEDDAVGQRMTSDVGGARETGDVSESRPRRMTINDVIVSCDVNNSN